jgi:hypothetical protein
MTTFNKNLKDSDDGVQLSELWSGLSPSFSILKTRKHDVSKTGPVSSSGEGDEGTYSVGSLT